LKYISVARPLIGRQEIQAVKKVLKSGNIAQGPEVARFEKTFSKYVDGRDCIAVNSGTSALVVALLALGIGVDDEVIVPSFTFAATANSVSLVGAFPVFVDIEASTYNMDASKIESAITPKTRAIIVVHLYGLPADMDKILAVAKRHNLLLIEDAAQAHLAQYNDKRVGTFGDAAAFSFYPTKNMTAGEGGMVVVAQSSQARICRLLRNQGMEYRYQNEITGYNFRMTDIHAAIGNVQLSKVEKWTEQRIRNASLLTDGLNSVQTPCVPSSSTHVFHQYTIRVDSNRDHFVKALEDVGIGTGVYYPIPVHQLPSFNRQVSLPETEKAANQVVSLPVHPELSLRDMRRIIAAVNQAIERSL
jgi:perosamine synthetase